MSAAQLNGDQSQVGGQTRVTSLTVFFKNILVYKIFGNKRVASLKYNDMNIEMKLKS